MVTMYCPFGVNLARSRTTFNTSATLRACASEGRSVRISVKVISGFGERDQGRKVVLRGQEIVA
jgi:hypothetical protein